MPERTFKTLILSGCAMKTLLHLLDFPTVPPKSEKKPQRKCSVCFWSHLNNAHDGRLPWHEGALQTLAGSHALQGRRCLWILVSDSVPLVAFFKAAYSFVAVNTSCVADLFSDYQSNKDSF